MKQLKVLASGWWESLSPEHQAEYVKEHPNSKYAVQYAKDHDEKKGDGGSKKPEKESKDSKKSDDHGDHSDKDSGKEGHKVKENGRLHKLFSKWMPKLSKEDREFFESDGAEEGSKQRRKTQHAVKDKSFDIVKSMKHQAHEWKTGMKAVHKIATKKSLNDHDKEALKAVTKDMIMIIGTVALGGGLAHGAIAALHHIGTDFVKDAILKSVAHAVVEGRVLAADDDEKLMQSVVENVGDFIGEGHIPDEAWEKAIQDRAKTNNIDNEGDFEETLPEEDEDDEDESDDDDSKEESRVAALASKRARKRVVASREYDIFRSLYEHMRQVGAAKLVSYDVKHGLKRHVLTFSMDSPLPAFYPVTGAVNIEFAYNELDEQWTSMGQIFGAVPDAVDPKMFLLMARQAIHERSTIQVSFLDRAMWFAERYASDLEQFQFKLGLDMGSSGTFTRIPNKQGRGDIMCWTSGIVAYNFKMYFSPPAQETQFGYSVENRFGFFEPTATHKWVLNAKNLAQVRKVIADASESMEKFCTDLSALIV